jgi:chlorophyllide a hydrolase
MCLAQVIGENYIRLLQIHKVRSPAKPLLTKCDRKKDYYVFLFLGWLTTACAAIAYILFTHKLTGGSYQVSGLIIFSICNGVLEQFMFIFWFVLGCHLGSLYAPRNFKLIFITGYISYFIFSGAIHAFFWLKVLPAHEVVTSIVIPLLSIASLIWMWLLWRYRAIVAIVAMHILIDFVAIGHLHFSWFEGF